MKPNPSKIIAVIAALTTAGHAQTINWGSDVMSNLLDSKGATMGDTFVFELGAFNSGFVPSQDNLASWFGNWHAFDTAAYAPEMGYFTASVDMQANGTSSPTATVPATPSFANLNAYLWVRNSNVADSASSEWLLVRDTSWVFPVPRCCDPTLPLEWSVSDLTPSDVPVYGYQKTPDGSRVGTGDVTYTPSYPTGSYLQTGSFSAVPEPCSAVMVLVLGVLGLTDRRRSW